MRTFARLENLNNKTAVITGAGGQVGFATATRLAQQGCRIVGLIRSKEQQVTEMFATLPNQHLNHLVIVADITNSDALDSARDKIDRCDILVNSAAITIQVPQSRVDLLTDDMFTKIINTNIIGTWAVIRTFTPLLRASGDGLIVNVSSTNADNSSKTNIAYCASKGAINTMTKQLSRSLSPYVRVVSVSPGILENSMNGITIKDEFYLDRVASIIPLNRVGTGDDVANTIEALATHIRFANGSIITLDGGRS